MFQVIANLIRYVLNWVLFRTIFHTIFFVLLPLNYLALSGHLSLFAYLPEILLAVYNESPKFGRRCFCFRNYGFGCFQHYSAATNDRLLRPLGLTYSTSELISSRCGYAATLVVVA